jgi:hypothetical protein
VPALVRWFSEEDIVKGYAMIFNAIQLKDIDEDAKEPLIQSLTALGDRVQHEILDRKLSKMLRFSLLRSVNLTLLRFGDTPASRSYLDRYDDFRQKLDGLKPKLSKSDLAYLERASSTLARADDHAQKARAAWGMKPRPPASTQPAR